MSISQSPEVTSAPTAHLRLGVNIDHVATIRNARGGRHPDPLRAAHLAVEAGADGITAHLREDRRHISDADIARLKRELTRPLNLEMAATDEMLAIALAPRAACLLPRAREARGAHHRRRARRRARREPPAPFRRGAEGRRHPRVAVHRARSDRDRSGRPPRRRHRRAAHGRLLRARAGGRRRRPRARARAAAARPRRRRPQPASRCTPGTGSPSTPSAPWRACRRSSSSTSAIS